MSKDLKEKLTNWYKQEPIYKADFFLTTKPDCSFVFEQSKDTQPQRLFSYKWMLSAISTVFEKMFNGHFRESLESSMDIKIEDIDFDDFKRFLDYVHYRELNAASWPNESWHMIPYISKKYMIPEIMETVFESRLKIFDSINVLNYFDYAYDDNVDKALSSFHDVKSKHFHFILRSPRLKEYDLKKFHKLLTLISVETWGSQFELVETWFKGYTFKNDKGLNENVHENADEIVLNVLKKHILNLDSLTGDHITIKDLIRGPGGSTILSYEEKFKILSKVVLQVMPDSQLEKQLQNNVFTGFRR